MWISCVLISEGHLIEHSSFRRFQSEEANVRASRIDDNRIRLSVRANPSLPESENIRNAHVITKALILALNVGALGYFYWENDPWVHPQFTITDDIGGDARKTIALIAAPRVGDSEHRFPFSDMDEYRTALLFGVFARGSTHVLEDEYCRGLLLLRMQFCEIDFRRDAFMCFYRALEHFVTRRVLGVAKLQNELKQLQSCIRSLGFRDDVVEEMRELYAVRSSQTAHAQNLPRQITGEEVLKLKIFVDIILNKELLKEANKIMEQKYGPPHAARS